MDHSPRFLAIVDDAKTRIREMTVGELQSHPGGVHLVDVREDREWAEGRIPNAVHVGRGILERDIEVRFPDLSARIVLYCGGGYRSALAADALRIMGYTDVFSLAGGIHEWREAGGAIEAG